MMRMSQQSRIGSSAEPPSQPDAVVVSVCRAEPYLRVVLQKGGIHISQCGIIEDTDKRIDLLEGSRPEGSDETGAVKAGVESSNLEVLPDISR
jgi:hypothetical protein